MGKYLPLTMTNAKLPEWADKIAKDLNLYWECTANSNQKGGVIQIKLLSAWNKFKLRWFKKFTVKEFYIWIKSNWSDFGLLASGFPIRHDNTHLSKALERRVSRIYQLQDNWIVKEDDLKYLVKGPLISEDGERILVQDHGRVATFFIWLEKYKNWLGFFLAVISFCIVVYLNFLK